MKQEIPFSEAHARIVAGDKSVLVIETQNPQTKAVEFRYFIDAPKQKDLPTEKEEWSCS